MKIHICLIVKKSLQNKKKTTKTLTNFVEGILINSNHIMNKKI